MSLAKYPLFSVAEVARRLHRTPAEVRRLIHRGPLLASKIFGRLLVSPEDLAKYLREAA
jgi:hypothetical protein